jgi:putative transposase
MKDNASYFNICVLSRIMGVSRSGYYEWLNRKPSSRYQENMRLKDAIKTAHEMSRGIYGYRRIHADIKEQKHICSLNRVNRLMREEGIRAKTRRKFKATTNSKHNLPINQNVLERDFTAKVPNTRWVTDITYVATGEGWLYLAVILDLFSRKVVGWAMDNRMTTELIKNALNMAFKQRKPGIQSYLVVHSDRGSQYASLQYQMLLQEYGLTASMSRKANCWDNAVAESFFRTLKTELIYHEQYTTREKASASIFEYIEVFYNRQRRHSTIGYACPEEYERMALAS